MDVRLDSRTYIKEVRARLLTALDDFRSSEKSLEVGEHHFLVYSIVLVLCVYVCMREEWKGKRKEEDQE